MKIIKLRQYLICILILFFGCKDNSLEKGQFTYLDILKVPIDTIPISLNTLNINNDLNSYLVLSAMHLGLLRKSPEGLLYPSASSHWTIDQINKVITFNLRQDLYFHDKQKFTCKDVSFTFNLLKERNVYYLRKVVKKFGCDGDFKFYVKFRIRPYRFFQWLASLESSILPSGHGNNKNSQIPIGLGAYGLVKRSNNEIQLKHIENHFLINKLSPRRIHFKLTDYNKIETKHTLKDLDFFKINEQKYPGKPNFIHSKYFDRVWTITFGRYYLKQKETKKRKCLYDSIDRDKFAKKLVANGIKAVPAFGIVSPSQNAYNPDLTSKLNLSTSKRYNCNIGNSIKVNVVEGITPDIILESLRESLAHVPFNIEFNVLKKLEFINKLATGDYEISLFAYNIDEEPEFAINRYFDVGSKSRPSLTIHNDNTIKSLLKEINDSSDDESRIHSIRQLEKYNKQISVIAPIIFSKSRFVFNRCLKVLDRTWNISASNYHKVQMKIGCEND